LTRRSLRKSGFFFPLGINLDTGAHKDPNHCAIIVTLIMELRLVNKEVTFNKFPISKMELFHVRKRLIYNLNRFDTARIFYHVKNNKK